MGHQPRATWTHELHQQFIYLCVDQVQKNNRPSSHLNKTGYKLLCEEFYKRTGKEYNKTQMKNHWDQTKEQWKFWTRLRDDVTGAGYSHELKTFSAGKDFWIDWFKGCIGAIDGTHVSAHIPLENQVPFRGRKGITQNVVATCSFDMIFTFVNAGWEGSANDWKVFLETINNPNMNFPRPPPGKYYVVDAGYPNRTGFFVPFRGVRYHLQDYRNNRAQTRKEMFNHHHSSLQNVIERTFGVLKARVPILKLMPSYPFPTQIYIGVACTTIHNFIREEIASDWLFRQYEDEEHYPREDDDEDSSEDDEPDFSTHASFARSSQRMQQLQMENIRDLIADSIGHDGGANPD